MVTEVQKKCQKGLEPLHYLDLTEKKAKFKKLNSSW